MPSLIEQNITSLKIAFSCYANRVVSDEVKINGKPYCYHSTFLVRIPPDLFFTATRAIAKTLDRLTNGELNEVSLIFGERIICPTTGDDLLNAADALPDENTIRFAMKALEELNLSINLTQRMVLVAAHEATHLVQKYRGVELRPSWDITSGEVSVLRDDYKYDPYEDEAWRESAKTFKEMYPSSSGAFQVNDRTYNI